MTTHLGGQPSGRSDRRSPIALTSVSCRGLGCTTLDTHRPRCKTSIVSAGVGRLLRGVPYPAGDTPLISRPHHPRASTAAGNTSTSEQQRVGCGEQQCSDSVAAAPSASLPSAVRGHVLARVAVLDQRVATTQQSADADRNPSAAHHHHSGRRPYSHRYSQQRPRRLVPIVVCGRFNKKRALERLPNQFPQVSFCSFPRWHRP